MTEISKAPKASGKANRRKFSLDIKRRLIEETLKPGALVAQIARAHDINAGLLYKWRRQYRKRATGLSAQAKRVASKANRNVAAWLPVSVIGDIPAQPLAAKSKASADTHTICEIEFARARMRLSGDVSAATLQLLIRELSQ